MRDIKSYLHIVGFSMVELLLLVSLIGIVSTISSAYLTGSLEKQRLISQRDMLIIELKAAQHNSIIAKGGKEYGLKFETDGVTTAPENRRIAFQHGIQLEYFDRPIILFEKLSGNLKHSDTTQGLSLVLVSSSFETTIRVNQYGVIEVSPPTKKIP